MVDTAVKERPILFSGEMVRAILDGRKTQTRRLNGLDAINQEPDRWRYTGYTIDTNVHHFAAIKGADERQRIKCPYGGPGDRLWVRETHYRYGKWLKNGKTPTGRQKWRFKPLTEELHYFDDPPEDVRGSSYRKEAWYKRPSIFMPRWASRINLEITDIRVERVQDITIPDTAREGIPWNEETNPKPRDGRLLIPLFAVLWDSINAKRGYPWKDNPYVWVVEFKC